MPPALCTQRLRQNRANLLATKPARYLCCQRQRQHLLRHRNAEAVTQPATEVQLRAAAAREPTAAARNDNAPAGRAFFSFSCSAMRAAAALTCARQARASLGAQAAPRARRRTSALNVSSSLSRTASLGLFTPRP